MQLLSLHSLHEQVGARFRGVSGAEVVLSYEDVPGEYAALSNAAGLLDLSSRGRLCLTGEDRVRFLHGQVSNDVKRLTLGQGCYAALITAKGKMEADLNLYCLADEILLDFEPGLEQRVTARLEKYVIADDVQVCPVHDLYGLLSIQGPRAAAAVQSAGFITDVPGAPFQIVKHEVPDGEICIVNQPRLGTAGFDFFTPVAALASLFERLSSAAKSVGGRGAGWDAFEIARVEQGIPRFGMDMDETNIPLEAGIETRAISFDKGCYIGQEVISRIRTYGHVTKSLCGLRFDPGLTLLPVKGDSLYHGGKPVGYITSAVRSPRLKANIALAYVRNGSTEAGARLSLESAEDAPQAEISALPFKA